MRVLMFGLTYIVVCLSACYHNSSYPKSTFNSIGEVASREDEDSSIYALDSDGTVASVVRSSPKLGSDRCDKNANPDYLPFEYSVEVKDARGRTSRCGLLCSASNNLDVRFDGHHGWSGAIVTVGLDDDYGDSSLVVFTQGEKRVFRPLGCKNIIPRHMLFVATVDSSGCVYSPDWSSRNGWQVFPGGKEILWGRREDLSSLSVPSPPKEVIEGSPSEYVALEVDDAGKVDWALTIGGEGNQSIYDVCPLRNGTMIVTGYCDSVLQYNSTIVGKPVVADPASEPDKGYVFVLKLSKKREVLWVKMLGPLSPDSAGGMATNVRKDGTVLIMSSFQGPLTYENGQGESITLDSDGLALGLLAAEVSSGGKLNWVDKIGSGFISSLSVCRLSGHEFFVSGVPTVRDCKLISFNREKLTVRRDSTFCGTLNTNRGRLW